MSVPIHLSNQGITIIAIVDDKQRIKRTVTKEILIIGLKEAMIKSIRSTCREIFLCAPHISLAPGHCQIP